MFKINLPCPLRARKAGGGMQCDICCHDYDSVIKVPKILKCGHTLCEQCLERIALPRSCPTCRTLIEGVAQTNYALIPRVSAINRMISSDEKACEVVCSDAIAVENILVERNNNVVRVKFVTAENKRFPVRVVVVLDISGSMETDVITVEGMTYNRIILLKQSMLFLINCLTDKDALVIITYSYSGNIVFSEESMSYENKIRANELVKKLSACGDTNMMAGLKLAFGKWGNDKKTVINLLCDGENSDTDINRTDRIPKYVSDSFNESNVISFNVFGFGPDIDENFCYNLSKDHGVFCHMADHSMLATPFFYSIISTSLTISRNDIILENNIKCNMTIRANIPMYFELHNRCKNVILTGVSSHSVKEVLEDFSNVIAIEKFFVRNDFSDDTVTNLLKSLINDPIKEKFMLDYESILRTALHEKSRENSQFLLSYKSQIERCTASNFKDAYTNFLYTNSTFRKLDEYYREKCSQVESLPGIISRKRKSPTQHSAQLFSPSQISSDMLTQTPHRSTVRRN